MRLGGFLLGLSVSKNRFLLFVVFLTFFGYQAFLQIWWDNNSLLGHICDDAYISLVYAYNLFSGNGFVYNSGEVVEGYTNFLWVLVMTIPFFLGVDPVFFVKVAAWISTCVLVVAVYLLARVKLDRFTAGVLAACLAGSSHIAYMASWGLETIFFMALYVSAMWAFASGRVGLSAFVFALAAMTRMEIVLVYGVFGLWLAVHAIKSLRFEKVSVFACVFLVVFGSYFFWRFSYYGYLLPNTYYAKVGGGEGSYALIIRGAKYVFEQLYALGILIPSFVACCVFVVWFVKRFGSWGGVVAPITFSAILYLLYIVLVGGDVFNERFIVHVLPLVLLSSVFLVDDVLQRQQMSKRRLVASVLPLFFFLGLFLSSPTFPVSSHLVAWVSVADYLKRNVARDEYIATDAAGAIKYYSGVGVIDVLGLNDTHIAHRKVDLGTGTAGHEKQDNAYVISREPSYITTWLDSDGMAGRGFKKFFEFRRAYQLEGLVETSGLERSGRRIVPVMNGEDACDIAKARNADGLGVHDWGIWKRRHSLLNTVYFNSFDFSSPYEDVIAKCQDGYIGSLVDIPRSGIWMYGPYIRFAPGDYTVAVTGGVSECSSVDKAFKLDVFDGREVILEKVVFSDEMKNFIAEINFRVTDNGGDGKAYEFRFSEGECAVRIDSISVSIN